jgi:hypothetical protein
MFIRQYRVEREQPFSFCPEPEARWEGSRTRYAPNWLSDEPSQLRFCLAHRAAAARFAISCRRFLLNVAARAFPPARPPDLAKASRSSFVIDSDRAFPPRSLIDRR